MTLRTQLKLENYKGKQVMFKYIPQTLIDWRWHEPSGQWLIVTDKRCYTVPESKIDDEVNDMQASWGKAGRFHMTSDLVLDDEQADQYLEQVCRILRIKAEVGEGQYSRDAMRRMVKQIEQIA